MQHDRRSPQWGACNPVSIPSLPSEEPAYNRSTLAGSFSLTLVLRTTLCYRCKFVRAMPSFSSSRSTTVGSQARLDGCSPTTDTDYCRSNGCRVCQRIPTLFQPKPHRNSTTTNPSKSRSNRDRSPHKYVMRSGFKMRQSASEGGGLVAHPRGGLALGHDGELTMDESLEDGLGGGGRLVVGNANSASTSSLATSPGGRAGDAM